MNIKLAKSEIIHFVGIGGIGMSGLSLIMKGKGFKVQGSDISNNKNIDRLKKEKIKILIGHKKQNISKATIVVVSSAIKKNNPELIEARKKQLPIYKRGEMLAHIVSLTKNIVVVGSHGKTTTTSLIASIFQETKIDPTIINGGVINSINNSAKLGKSDWSILEADESDGSFIFIPPTYSIITNIDREHMDFYNSMEELNKYFIKFVNKVPSFGKSFICLDDKNNKNLIKRLNNTIATLCVVVQVLSAVPAHVELTVISRQHTVHRVVQSFTLEVGNRVLEASINTLYTTDSITLNVRVVSVGLEINVQLILRRCVLNRVF